VGAPNGDGELGDWDWTCSSWFGPTEPPGLGDGRLRLPAAAPCGEAIGSLHVTCSTNGQALVSLAEKGGLVEAAHVGGGVRRCYRATGFMPAVSAQD
jgi:hypothetical protein